MHLSRTEVKSFCGDIVTLQLVGYNQGDVQWITENVSLVRIREFDSFRDGVLLVLNHVGSTVVRAIYDDHTFECKVIVREAKTAGKESSLQYFIGDLHAHTGYSDGQGTPHEAFASVKKEGVFDFQAITDHALNITDQEFFETFLAAERHSDEHFVAFAANEGSVELQHNDRFGIRVMEGGEVVTLQADGYCISDRWEPFIATVNQNPYMIASYAHPQEASGGTEFIWDGYSLRESTTDEKIQMVHMIETINYAQEESYNLIHERAYSVALDCGYQIAPIAVSDTHEKNWGTGSMRGRTVIMAPSRTRELLLDAMRRARVYSTEDGNTKLWYTVNGKGMAETLEPCDTYLFEIYISTFDTPKLGEEYTTIEIISDYGQVIKEINISGYQIHEKVRIYSNSARYFYIKVYNAAGDRTWSAPVWTGRSFETRDILTSAEPICKKKWRVHMASNLNEAEKVYNNNPRDAWELGAVNGEIIIDMGQVYNLSAVSYYRHEIPYHNAELVASLLSDYEIETSVDGVDFVPAAKGMILSYGREQIITFHPRSARFFRMAALKSVGARSKKIKYQHAPIIIGELSAYEIAINAFMFD